MTAVYEREFLSSVKLMIFLNFREMQNYLILLKSPKTVPVFSLLEIKIIIKILPPFIPDVKKEILILKK